MIYSLPPENWTSTELEPNYYIRNHPRTPLHMGPYGVTRDLSSISVRRCVRSSIFIASRDRCIQYSVLLLLLAEKPPLWIETLRLLLTPYC